MEKLQHGIYDNECEGLTHKEINTFYSFGEGGELHIGNEDPDQSDQDQEEDRSDNYKDIEACLLWNCLIHTDFIWRISMQISDMKQSLFLLGLAHLITMDYPCLKQV